MDLVYHTQEPLSSIEEARRFASNILDEKNRGLRTGVIYSNDLLPELTAGTKFTVDTPPYRDRLAVATHVRHDLQGRKTKTWFRVIGTEG